MPCDLTHAFEDAASTPRRAACIILPVFQHAPGGSRPRTHIQKLLTPTAHATDSHGSTRLRGIDALRGAAALAVVLYHAVGQTKSPSSGVVVQLFDAPVRVLAAQGYTGVFLFFVISGFCIHLNQAKARAAGRDGARVGFFSFWRRRVLRLYPPYLVALFLCLACARATGQLPFTKFFAWDLAAHLLMIHNFDARTCYSINSVFWTLAIEEQLYLAYFLLLFLRRRFGWTTTLACCLAARVACFALLATLRASFGIDIPLPEAAASHWFTWALGALAVESAFGLVKLPRWCKDLRVGALALVSAAAIAQALPTIEPRSFSHVSGWLLLHPLWGFGFFVVLNRAVAAERGWRQSRSLTTTDGTRVELPTKDGARVELPRAVAWLPAVGLFSYSLYLTHHLVLLEAWRFEWLLPLPALLVALFIMTPLCVAFAWLFFQLFERPFLARASSVATTHATPARQPTRVTPARPAAHALATRSTTRATHAAARATHATTRATHATREGQASAGVPEGAL
jgi:peptidoglycan/LPS O-acetylase OafA/YrhL